MSVSFAEDDVLDAVYMGCSDLESWSRMLGRVARVFDAEAMICRTDAAFLASERTYSFSDDASPDETTCERVVDRSERADPPAGMPASCVALGPADGQPGYWLLLRDDTMRAGAAFILHREAPAFTAREAERLARLAPHLFRAVRLHAQIARATSRAETALALLDLLKTPVFLVDSRFSVVLSNAAARDLERRGVVKLNRRRLSFRCQETMRRAQRIVVDTGNGGSVSEQDRLIRFEQPDGASLLAVVEPLDGLFPGRDAAPDDAVAAIFLKDPGRPVRSVEAVMREMHGMPPAEARLAAAIADGRTIKEYAAEADLSESYVRDLSKRVMQRLGVRRQQQLVRAIIQTAPEIGG